jgi:prepilin-type processing-associated H-X9-DG protein
MPWGYSYFEAIAGHPYTPGDPGWSAVFNGAYRCPVDRRSDRWSYGYNVYFELDANETDGSSWRRLSAIPRPAATVVFTELSDLTSADHAMAHFWVQFDAPPEVDPDRHRPGTGVVFADGHAQTRDFKTLFDFNSEVDCFDPQTAR